MFGMSQFTTSANILIAICNFYLWFATNDCSTFLSTERDGKDPWLRVRKKENDKVIHTIINNNDQIMIKWQLVRRIYDLFIIWIFEIWSVLPNMVVKGALPSRSVKKLKTLFREPLYQLFKQCCFPNEIALKW